MLLACLLAACRFDHGGSDIDAAAPIDIRADMPIDQATVDPDGPISIVIEAEAPTTTVSSDGVHAWVIETSMTGFSGAGYVTALPNDFNNCTFATDVTCGAYSTYAITIPAAGTYRVTVRHYSTSGANDSVHWYLGAAAIAENLDPDIATMWTDDATTMTVAMSAGPATFGLRMRETGSHIDSIRLDRE